MTDTPPRPPGDGATPPDRPRRARRPGHLALPDDPGPPGRHDLPDDPHPDPHPDRHPDEPPAHRRARARARLESAREARLPDLVAEGLTVLIAGINPGLTSAADGHHFATPGNRFWPALHRAGSPRGSSPRPRRPSCWTSVSASPASCAAPPPAPPN